MTTLLDMISFQCRGPPGDYFLTICRYHVSSWHPPHLLPRTRMTHKDNDRAEGRTIADWVYTFYANLITSVVFEYNSYMW